MCHLILLVRLPKIKEWVDEHDPGSAIIPFSGCLELKLLEMEDDAAREAYLKEHQATRFCVQLLLNI